MSAGSDGVDSESNSNGQKLLNGGAGGGGADSQTGASDSLGDGISHLDFTGTVASSSHNFLLSLMGGGDPFGPGVHINIPGHMTPPTQLDSTVISSGVTAAQHSGTSLDSPADLAYHINIDQLGVDLTALSSEPDQSPSSSVSSSAYPAAQGADGTDTPDVNGNSGIILPIGNGRQTLLTDTNTAADQFVSFTDLQTEVTGGADSVTSLHVDLTASGLGLTHDVTESTPVILHTASGGSTHTDLVTMAADSTGTDSGHPAVTDHTQMAGSVTEQYNPSGQGPEGAENVELEDTC
ncbi:uncharacterized protein si:ch211-80h18.1 [Acanthopagrus latus]|uniref:uncharacterized protein si:ch211-80h18.1 n=1 Tax=Acanthopagrus latus TaxID=8177 RepID=UPI00187CA66B|nr:uncharacterized protein si:ch211-80h18.1 [Acanthopagrus latus]